MYILNYTNGEIVHVQTFLRLSLPLHYYKIQIRYLSYVTNRVFLIFFSFIGPKLNWLYLNTIVAHLQPSGHNQFVLLWLRSWPKCVYTRTWLHCYLSSVSGTLQLRRHGRSTGTGAVERENWKPGFSRTNKTLAAAAERHCSRTNAFVVCHFGASPHGQGNNLTRIYFIQCQIQV